jgi:Bacterial SH3 domain
MQYNHKPRRSNLLRLLVIALVFTTTVELAHTTTAEQARKLYPVDEASKDPAFFTFRARLMQAVQRRDANYLVSILSPKIMNSFGGDGGVAEFKQKWKPERGQSEVWVELAECLSLGGKFDTDGSFAAPYLFNGFPEDLDVFTAAAIIGEKVRLRAAPKSDSSVIRELSFDIVDVPDWQVTKAQGETRNWIKVKLKDGQTGYVAEEFIRSPIDYRAIFEKENGRWVMTAFIAGD